MKRIETVAGRAHGGWCMGIALWLWSEWFSLSVGVTWREIGLGVLLSNNGNLDGQRFIKVHVGPFMLGFSIS